MKEIKNSKPHLRFFKLVLAQISADRCNYKDPRKVRYSKGADAFKGLRADEKFDG